MPVYEYECCKCGKVVEAWQSLSDAPMTECPDCSGSMKKLISRSSFRLKGGGWYADGYASTPSSSSSSSTASSSVSKPNADSGKKSESSTCTAEKKASCGCG